VHEEIIFRVLQAVNDHAHGKTEPAIQSLAYAVSMAQPGGYVRVFLDEGEFMQSLLAMLAARLKNGQGLIMRQQQSAPLKEYVAMLLSAFELSAGQAEPRTTTPSLPARDLLPGVSIQGQPLVEPLSSRELEVLRLLARGYSDKKIAETLVIAPETVHKHLKNIYGKLDVHSRTEAIARAREQSLL
jgi:LuxR family maltose regulon positive regulatory protein